MIGFLASMKYKITNRQFLSAAVVIFYLIPLLFFSILSMTIMPHYKSWTLFSLGLLLAVIGTFALTLLLYYWEQSVGGSKKELSQLFSLPAQDYSSTGSENKVTSLDPSMDFEPPFSTEAHAQADPQVSTKELNLLETALKANQEQQEQLAKALEMKSQELEAQVEENKQLELKAFQIAQDFADYKLFSEEQLKQKQLQLTALQQMIDDQRTEMEKRQDQIYQLDTKVHDLSYEIKTLLYLNEEEPPQVRFPSMFKEPEAPHAFAKGALPAAQEQTSGASQAVSHEAYASENPVRTPLEASALLRKCINMAQKLTGANYHGNESSRYREFSTSYYAIDQRRLFDNLRGEPGALIIVYSQKENKLLFVNNESKTLLGWSPEKFVADFSSIVHEGINDWKKALSMLANASDSQARLLAKTKQGQEIVLNCQLGAIPTGLFRNHVIGILYPA